MVGYIAHTLFGTLDSLNEGKKEIDSYSVAQSYVRVHEVDW